VQIDFAFKRQDIRTVLTRRQSGGESAFFHLISSFVNASPSGRIDYGFHIWKIVISIDHCLKRIVKIIEETKPLRTQQTIP